MVCCLNNYVRKTKDDTKLRPIVYRRYILFLFLDHTKLSTIFIDSSFAVDDNCNYIDYHNYTTPTY